MQSNSNYNNPSNSSYSSSNSSSYVNYNNASSGQNLSTYNVTTYIGGEEGGCGCDNNQPQYQRPSYNQQDCYPQFENGCNTQSWCQPQQQEYCPPEQECYPQPQECYPNNPSTPVQPGQAWSQMPECGCDEQQPVCEPTQEYCPPTQEYCQPPACPPTQEYCQPTQEYCQPTQESCQPTSSPSCSTQPSSSADCTSYATSDFFTAATNADCLGNRDGMVSQAELGNYIAYMQQNPQSSQNSDQLQVSKVFYNNFNAIDAAGLSGSQPDGEVDPTKLFVAAGRDGNVADISSQDLLQPHNYQGLL